MTDEARSKKIGKKLRQLIKENYKTQQEFADRYGCDLRTVSRYIKDGIRDIDVIQELADLFQIDFFDFIS